MKIDLTKIFFGGLILLLVTGFFFPNSDLYEFVHSVVFVISWIMLSILGFITVSLVPILNNPEGHDAKIVNDDGDNLQKSEQAFLLYMVSLTGLSLYYVVIQDYVFALPLVLIAIVLYTMRTIAFEIRKKLMEKETND